MLGGGALYSAIGAQIWSDSVGVHSVTGREVYDDVREQIASRGLDGEGVGAIDGVGLQLWLLHESETFKRQVPKLISATAEEMDRGRGPLPKSYLGARGFHVAPQSPESTAENVRTLSELPHRPVVSVDILSDEYIDRRAYADLGFLRGASAFLPSEQEIARIWGAVGYWRVATRDRITVQMPYGCKARRTWISCVGRRERRLDLYASAPGQSRGYDRGRRRLLRGVLGGSRVRQAARGMRGHGRRVRVLCCRSLRSAGNRTPKPLPVVRRGCSACLRRPDMRSRRSLRSHGAWSAVPRG